LEAIRRRGLKISIYAPEGIEPRLVEPELMTFFRSAGFEKIHLALETIDNNIARLWNRRQATIEKFDRAVDVLKQVGFEVGSQDINAFVIFGLPDEVAGGGEHGSLCFDAGRVGRAHALYAGAGVNPLS